MEIQKTANLGTLGTAGAKDPTGKPQSPMGEAPYTHGSQSSPADSLPGGAKRAESVGVQSTRSARLPMDFECSAVENSVFMIGMISSDEVNAAHRVAGPAVAGIGPIVVGTPAAVPLQSELPDRLVVNQIDGSNHVFAVETAVQGPAGAAGVPPVAGAVYQCTSLDSELLQSEWLDRQRVHPIGTINTGLPAGTTTFGSGEPGHSSLAAYQNLQKSAQNDPCGSKISEREHSQSVLAASGDASRGVSTSSEAFVTVEAAHNTFLDQKLVFLGSERAWECMEMPLSIYDKSMDMAAMLWNNKGQVPINFSGVSSSFCTDIEQRNTGEPVETHKKAISLEKDAGMAPLDDSKNVQDYQEFLKQTQVRFQLGWTTPANVEDVSSREQAFLENETLRPATERGSVENNAFNGFEEAAQAGMANTLHPRYVSDYQEFLLQSQEKFSVGWNNQESVEHTFSSLGTQECELGGSGSSLGRCPMEGSPPTDFLNFLRSVGMTIRVLKALPGSWRGFSDSTFTR